MIRSAFLFIFLFVILLSSCKDEKTPCEDAFVSRYSAVQSAFANVYRSDADADDLEVLEKNIESFLSNHRDEKCTYNGSVIDATAEADQFLAQINKGVVKMVSKVVYGTDNRVDVDDSPNDDYRNWAQATAAMIPNYRIGSDGAIYSNTLGVSKDLCSGERFADQINPAICSGFLIGSDILVTAGHCVESLSDCSDYKWVFNFRDNTIFFDSDDSYECVEVLGREQAGNGADYAVVRLDREVPGITPLKFRVEGKVRDNAPLVVIGHPSGLPAKIADGASVRSNSPSQYFVANLDTFGGNSGSAVLDAETGMVEGILVRGETDYISMGSCDIVNTCSDSGCSGEDVTRMTALTGIPSELLIVDGGWSDWGSWSHCSGGTQTHTRSCNNPVPSEGGDDCDGGISESRDCINFTLSEAFSGIYDQKNFAEYDQYGVISFLGFQQGSYILMGRSLFDLCGMHAVDGSNGDWLVSSVVSCSNRGSLGTIYDIFSTSVLSE